MQITQPIIITVAAIVLISTAGVGSYFIFRKASTKPTSSAAPPASKVTAPKTTASGSSGPGSSPGGSSGGGSGWSGGSGGSGGYSPPQPIYQPQNPVHTPPPVENNPPRPVNNTPPINQGGPPNPVQNTPPVQVPHPTPNNVPNVPDTRSPNPDGNNPPPINHQESPPIPVQHTPPVQVPHPTPKNIPNNGPPNSNKNTPPVQHSPPLPISQPNIGNEVVNPPLNGPSNAPRLNPQNYSTMPAKSVYDHYLTYQIECKKSPVGAFDHRLNKDRLKVMNFNAEWLFMYSSGTTATLGNRKTPEEYWNHIKDIATVLRRHNADIVHITEIEDCRVLTILADMLSDLKYAPYLISGTDKSLNQNVGFLSKVSISSDLKRITTSTKNISFHDLLANTKEKVCKNPSLLPTASSIQGNINLGKEYSATINLNMNGGNKTLKLFGVHLKGGYDTNDSCVRRLAQSYLLSEYGVKKSNPGDIVIVMGDFNESDMEVEGSRDGGWRGILDPTDKNYYHSGAVDYLRKENSLHNALLSVQSLLKCTEWKTESSYPPAYPIDHILYKGCRILSATIDTSSKCSDHHPVMAEFDLTTDKKLISAEKGKKSYFIAIPLNLGGVLDNNYNAYRNSNPLFAKGMPANKMLHLTASFLGVLNDGELEEVKNMVKSFMSGKSNFNIQLGGTKCLSKDAKKCEVFVLEVLNHNELSDLFAPLFERLQQLNFITRPPTWHCTIVNSKYGKQGIFDATAINISSLNNIPPITVSHIRISELGINSVGPDGFYTTVSNYPLRQ